MKELSECFALVLCVVVFRIFHLVKKEEVVVSDLIRETSNKISGIVLILYITICYVPPIPMTVQEPIEWKMIVQIIIYGKVELDSGNVYLYLVLGESPYCMYFVNIIFHSTEWHKSKLLTITCVLIWHHLLRWYTLALLADIAMLFKKTHNIPSSSCIQILTYLTHTHSKSVLKSYFSWTIFFKRSCSFNHHHHYQPPLPVFFWSRCTFSLWPSFSRLAGRDAKIAVLFY